MISLAEHLVWCYYLAYGGTAMIRFVLALCLVSVPVVLQADIADLSVGSTTESVGTLFTVPVSISNVTDLYAFQFDVSYDPSIVQLLSVTEGPFLPSAGTTFFIPGTIDNVGGSATFNADALIGPISGATGSGDLADLNFQGVGQGASNLTLANEFLFDSNLNSISFTPLSGQVVISGAATPEPTFLPPLILISLSLCVAVVIQRRRRVSSGTRVR
jgi:general secretion pathway protein D